MVPTLEVLVAEESRTQRMLVSFALEKCGHRVTSVEDGQQAVDLLGKSNFDLVLMDVEMPVLDGPTATRAIRHCEATMHRHVLILALTSTDSREDCLAAGMDGYLRKPIKILELNAILEDLWPAWKPRNPR